MHKKRFILSVIIMIMLLIPAALNAQGLFGSDGFFKVNEDNYANRTLNTITFGDGMNISPMEMEDPTVPLGSGLLIMVMSGVGYIILKNKEEKL